ncbi:MAG: radical SAM protein, partial [Candidatus Aminicenantes bacterium]|nr:radical SAM protein [Candidatus Aminicenantes bacterium]
MKITLIEPGSPGFHVFSKYPIPRLGLPIIGTILHNQGHEVTILCEDIIQNNGGSIDWSSVFSSDLVGISTITSTAPKAYAIADRVREKKIPVVMGGAHVTFLPDEALEHCDYVVRGEGEKTIVEFIEAFEDSTGSKAMSNILGLSFKEGTKIRHNADRPLMTEKEFESQPFPDLTLIEGHEKIMLTPIMTSRGCPHRCKFCSVTPMFGRKYRRRSVESVISEIKDKDPKPRQIFFYDDNFAADLRRSKRLLRRMKEEDLVIPWSAQIRTDATKDGEFLSLSKETKCFLFQIGMESINPDTLKDYHKLQDVKDIIQSNDVLKKFGIRAHGMFVLGSDSDDVQTIRDTVSFAKKHKIFTVQFLVLVPLPGTETFRELDAANRIFTKDWSLYDGHHVVFEPNPEKMTVYQL